LYARPEETIPALAGLHFTLIVSAVASVSVIFQKIMDREGPVLFPVNGLLLALGAIVVASTMAHGDTLAALQDVSRLVALVLMTCNLVRTPARYRALSNAIVFFTVYLSLFSIVHYYLGIAFNRGGIMQAEATGIFNDPNDLSATIVGGLGLTLCSAAAASGPRRWFYALAAASMVWAIYLTNSRGGMLALIVTVGAFLLITSRSRWIALALLLVIGAGAIKYGPSRFHQMDAKEESASSRFRFWHTGTLLFLANPVTGAGYGQFPLLNDGYTAHNSFVLCYAELGLPGYFCWIGCLYYAFRGLRRRKVVEAPAESRAMPATDGPRAPPPASQASRAGAAPDAGAATHGAAGRATRPRRTPVAGPPKTDMATQERFDRIGSRLALAAFLVGAFWISRTYVPVLYLLISLPLAQQIAYLGPSRDFSLTPRERWTDAWTILAICVASITFIALLAFALRR
ncbi:MAG TPA: O-antigen ligase family protein, partial [Chthonomonadaceae bacterium]|nr:O-antigen ligase family protein [Chthonomonadaceae bacterium]